MNPEQIADVLEVREILTSGGGVTKVIAALLDWKYGTDAQIETVTAKARESFVAQQDHSAAEDAAAEAEPEPEPEPEPVAPPAKKAAATSAPKARAASKGADVTPDEDF
jgi:hypothetical protein